jgi:hypothetical protein
MVSTLATIASALLVLLSFSSVATSFRLKTTAPSIRNNHRSNPIIRHISNLETDAQEEVPVPEFVQEINKVTIGVVKDLLGVIYKDRPYARFAALETIARVPYFSCTYK